MSSSTTATDANAEAIDFASAKNFWQTRATRSQSRSDLPAVESLSSASTATKAEAPKAEAKTVTATKAVTTTKTVATKAVAAKAPSAKLTIDTTITNDVPQADGPSTPIEQYPGDVEEKVEAKAPTAAPASVPPPAPPVAAASVPAAAATAPSALTRMTSMTGSMTSFRSKFFSAPAPAPAPTTTTANASAEQKDKDKEPSPSASAPAIPAMPQLPDMSAWKDKMKMNRQMSFSLKDLSTSLKTSLSSAAAVAVADPEKVAMARNNIQRPAQAKPEKPGASASAFGELVVAEVLAAKDLAAADYFQGESDRYIIVRFHEWERRTTIVKNTKSPVFNERFVFYMPPPAAGTAEEAPPGLVSVLVMNKNLVMSDLHLGEVHISLEIPVNEAFDEWYPLVKENGEQQGHVRVGVRRMALTSAELQAAAQALAANQRSLNDEDLAEYGSVLPDLWYGFAEAAEPLEEKASQADVLATKLNDLSRRFIGIELTSTELTSDGKRRDIF